MKNRFSRIASAIILSSVALVAGVAILNLPVRALVENQSFGIFGVAPVSTQPAGAGQSAITDNSTGTAGTTIAAGAGVQTITVPIILSKVSAADILSAYTPGYKFKILSASFAVSSPATTGSKLATVGLKISGVAVTGGATALTSANCTPLGALVAGSSVTAANTGSASDTITVAATSVTAFVEGEGYLLLTVQNMDTADAVASLSRQSTAWRTLLVALGLAKGSA